MQGIRHGGDSLGLDGQERLLLSLAEQLSRPFTQLSRLAELADGSDAVAMAEYWKIAAIIADSSLHLVEDYALSLRLNGKLTPLAIEPVSISALLYDTASQLEPFAKQYGVELQLDTGPRMQPLLTDRTVLQSVFTSLGQVFVLAQAERGEPGQIHLAAHRSRYGIVAGLYGNHEGLASDSLRRARSLHGRAREPLHKLVSGPATGIFVADTLLQTLSSQLHVARYHKLTGLAATLAPSHQLQLV